MIDIADVVIATGRGVMEAASKNKILMITTDKSSFPVLINQRKFFEANFSPRANIVVDEINLLNDISDLLKDKDIKVF